LLVRVGGGGGKGDGDDSIKGFTGFFLNGLGLSDEELSKELSKF